MNKPYSVHAPLPDDVHAAMDDLVTGQASPLSSWRLRWRIARDPRYAREWAKLQEIHADMQQLAHATSELERSRPATSPQTIRVGKMILQKRTAWVAATALGIFAMTGAIASRHFAPLIGGVISPDPRRASDSWDIRGAFRGKVRLTTPTGTEILTYENRGSTATGSLNILYSRKVAPQTLRTIAHSSIRGMGRHALRTSQGVLVAFVELSSLTAAEDALLVQDDRNAMDNLADFVRRPERVTPTYYACGKDYVQGGYNHVVEFPGVVGGRSVGVDPVKGFDFLPYSWKSYGQVHVVARLRLPPKKFYVSVDKDRRLVSLGKRTVIDEAESLPIPTPEQMSQLPSEYLPYIAPFPSRGTTVPETYWQVAQDYENHKPLNKQGNWKRVLRSGWFKGYGHFVVRDQATQDVLLTLDVTPATAKDALTALTNREPVKQTRVVSGWASEK